MTNKKGFTLLELLIVVVIVGVLAALTIPNMRSSVERTRSRSAQFNLQAIYNAEKRYKLRNNKYYYGANTQAAINENLQLNIQDSYFTYQITGSADSFNATATRFDPSSICANKKMRVSHENSTIEKECNVW
jgi:prepilin-type N-terminal cleavage/methylation domain-containing protein